MNSDKQEALAFQVERTEASLHQLNARIARLVITLRPPLRTEEDFNQLLAGHHPLLSIGGVPDSGSGQRRLHQELEELRGLMVMRCELMTHALNNFGLELTYQIAAKVEEELEREGFRSGADGFYLLRRIKSEYQA